MNNHYYLYLRSFPYNDKNINDGLSKAVHGLAYGLTKCNAKVTILCESLPDEDTFYQTDVGYEIRCFAHPVQTRPSFQISSGLRQYIRKNLNGSSLVILNGILHPSVYSLSRILKKSKIPYIVAPHDPYNRAIFHKNAHLKLPYWYLLERKILREAAGVQILDARHQTWLAQLGVNTPVIALPNGFTPKEVYPEVSLQWHRNKVNKLFFLGRIDSYNKGLDLLLDAFAQISHEENVHLTMQGPDWGDKKRLQAKAALLSVDKYTSFIEPDFEKPASLLIQEYDIFCMTSRFEGFGLSALEAMLAGRVLLVSDIAGIAPHVKASGCGIVVAPNVSEIKSGLAELIARRSEWKEMGLRGREYVLKHLSWDKIASVALEKYQQLNLLQM